MHSYYLLIVTVLFLLAITLLIIGVSNDAVNFLNSAIGSKAASFSMIILIAGIGVLLGAVFSNGMMEVARKGIFNPEVFAFDDIMVIFLAVMLTNILLLDFFNTIGLPTSTTISIVFGILGAAVAVSFFKIKMGNAIADSIEQYINISSSIMIIIGIFLSVIIAFHAGVIIQWIVRMAFSFNLKISYKYWSGIWGGFAITAILYFLLIKGAKGSTLVTPEILDYIQKHTLRILCFSFLGWTILFQLLILFTKINILKITVLVGTFALAMAFAGNDLVNFIGVPLAGYESFKAFAASGSSNAGGYMMEALNKPVNTPVYFLIAAGLIMVLTLRFSKKAKSVTATTIDLSRQSEGSERFNSSILAKLLVRVSIDISNIIARITPPPFTRFIEQRFNTETITSNNEEKLAFDLVRASVNLVVASILISIGTSLKLPLSTTYVTFMVTMGTSLADGAWGRDSAVYRITGVLTVIGGWFFTAFIALLASFVIAAIVFFGKLIAIIILLILAVFILIRSHSQHKKKAAEKARLENEALRASCELLNSFDREVLSSITRVSEVLNLTYSNFVKEKFNKLKKLRKESKLHSKEIKKIREEIPVTIQSFEDADLEIGHNYVEVITYMKETYNCLTHIIQPAYDHLHNSYPVEKKQSEKLKDFNHDLNKFFNFVINMVNNRDYDNLDELVLKRDIMISQTNDILLNRIKILKKTQKGVNVSVTYMNILSETKSLLLNIVQLVKAEAKLLEAAGIIYDPIKSK